MLTTKSIFVALLLCLFWSISFAQESNCDKYPDSLGCTPLTLPGADPIPSQEVPIDLAPGETFSGGGCPADVASAINGSPLVLLPMSTACSWISSFVRPLFLLIAAITAVFIVLPEDGD